MTSEDLLAEDMLSLAQAARLFPGARGAARVSPSTVFRWCTRGARTSNGVVKLDSCRVGSRLFTTRQAVSRWVAALSAPAAPVPSPARTPSARQKASEAAAAALKEAGA